MKNLGKLRHKIMLISLRSLVLYSCYEDIDDNKCIYGGYIKGYRIGGYTRLYGDITKYLEGYIAI